MSWFDAIYMGEDDGANPFAVQSPSRNGELHAWLVSGGRLADFATRNQAETIVDPNVAISIPGALK